ncbi:MAG TPA: ABC transporter permease [Kineosporiaceae bacterium]|nr:ABC transporter permease [Kineosporiaceae bacterium]
MNATIARLTWRSLLGRRRAILLMVLPAILLVLAVVFRLAQGSDAEPAAFLLSSFGVAFLVPLLGLIAGTGSIGPEIDDGSIVYVLAKPLSRYSIVLTKLVVAAIVLAGFSALPILIAGFIMAGGDSNVAVGFAAGSLVAGFAYSALFLLLAVITRNAVVVGLLYALVWESAVGSFVPGAQSLSIQKWGMAITEKIIGTRAEDLQATSPVALTTAVILLVVVTVGATAYAGYRLRSIRLTSDE